MSRIIGLVAAAALLASVSAYAQDSTAPSQPASPPAAAGDSSAPAAGDASKSDDASKMDTGKHHRHHHMREGSASTDNDADKLNACQVSANPTPEQQQCLHQAENSPG